MGSISHLNQRRAHDSFHCPHERKARQAWRVLWMTIPIIPQCHSWCIVFRHLLSSLHNSEWCSVRLPSRCTAPQSWSWRSLRLWVLVHSTLSHCTLISREIVEVGKTRNPSRENLEGLESVHLHLKEHNPWIFWESANAFYPSHLVKIAHAS